MVKSSNRPLLRCSLRARPSDVTTTTTTTTAAAAALTPSHQARAQTDLFEDHDKAPLPNSDDSISANDAYPQSRNADSSTSSFSRLSRQHQGHPAVHERRFKKPKLDAQAENGQSPPPPSPLPSSQEALDKLPLRSRDPQGHRPTRTHVVTRKLRKTSNNRPLEMSESQHFPASHSQSPADAARQSRTSRHAPSLAVDEATAEQSPPTPLQNGVADDDTAGRPATQPHGLRASLAGQRRSLRSHDGGSRAKSELAMYFPNYEEILSLQPTKAEFLSPDTTITLVDDLSESLAPPSEPSQSVLYAPRPPEGVNPLLELHNAQVVELPAHVDESAEKAQDPLTDDLYFKAHRRLERGEKQLRNIERERAQHEKIQLERILSDLQGHDWLRVMGISGVTDSEKKLYEPKRAYFIKEVSALLEKFRAWKEEEKRRKLERDELLAAEDEGVDEDEDRDEGETDGAGGERGEPEEGGISEAQDGRTAASGGGALPDVDDLDGWAAHQLQLEAMSATCRKSDAELPNPSSDEVHQSRPAPSGNKSRSTNPPAFIEPQVPFTSFYDKPHLRAAALGQSRRGRTRTAFGKPLPEMPEQEFSLPEAILTPDAIVASQRRSRLRRREQSKK